MSPFPDILMGGGGGGGQSTIESSLILVFRIFSDQNNLFW